MTTNVGIFLFPEVEVLDFAGPYEVFTTAARVAVRLHSESPKAFSVFSIAETVAPVTARADLQQAFPSLDVLNNVRWVDEGTVVTSAGISAGIDMSLHLVSRIAGMQLAEATARQMEFEWAQKSG